MSKKIKALVQKYEKDMQFENRFDELKHKLDLIPDAEVKTEVFTIKRKVMPAYAMMVVLLMLVTGIIGLQFGLNNDFVDGPTTVDSVEFRLMELVDIYDRETAAILFIEDVARINIYIGYLDNQEVIVLSGRSILSEDVIVINYNNTEYEITMANNYTLIHVIDVSNIELDIDITYHETVRVSDSFQLNFTTNFQYLGL
jgi:hypothetical protein